MSIMPTLQEKAQTALKLICELMPSRMDVATMCLLGVVWIGAHVQHKLEDGAWLSDHVGHSVTVLSVAVPESQFASDPAYGIYVGGGEEDLPRPQRKPPAPKGGRS